MTREEAIRIIRETYHTDEEMNALESLIPELRESEDERVAKAIDEIMKLSRTWGIAARYGFTAGDIRRWVKKQKEQKPAEWSEEDADMLNCCISSIEEAKENRYAYKETDGDTSYDREIAWLKSLRPSWKPSEEQMRCLCEVVDEAIRKHNLSIGGYPRAKILESLYKQLQKL